MTLLLCEMTPGKCGRAYCSGRVEDRGVDVSHILIKIYLGSLAEIAVVHDLQNQDDFERPL